MYFVLRPKLQASKEIDKKTEEQNQVLRIQKEDLTNELNGLHSEISETKNNLLRKNNEINSLLREIDKLTIKEEETKKRIEETRSQADKDTNIIFQKSYDLIQEKLS